MMVEIWFQIGYRDSSCSIKSFNLEIWSSATVVYSPSATILFGILCQTASKNLSRIRQKTNELIEERPVDIVNRVDQLKEYYFRNAEFVYEINNFFGFTLLLEISSGVFEIVVQIFTTVAAARNSESLLFYLAGIDLLILYTVNIIIITFVSENIIQEVHTLMK